MRKVNQDNITKPTLKIMMQVYIPYNDGSNSGELVESQDFCFLDESTNDISKMTRAMVSDAKEIAIYHQGIIKVKLRNKPNHVIAEPAKLDTIKDVPADAGVDLPPAPVSIRKKAVKKPAAKKRKA